MRGFEKLLKTTIDTLEHLSVAAHNQPPQPNYNYNYQQQHPPSQNTTGLYEGAAYSRVVYPNPTDGKLVYPPYNEFGDHLFDFSAAGYNEGWTPLPAVGPVTASLDPVPGSQDDSGRIQQAINELAATPSQSLKTLQLNRGNFVLARPVEISSSGIVLQGDPAGGTIITVMTDPLDTPYVFKISGEPNVMSKKRVPIVDDYIPVGHNQVTVRDKNRFKVGDTVMVGVAFNDAWIKAVGMDVIIPKGDTSKNIGWKAGRFEHHRRIVRIDESGTRLTLNEPITAALSSKHGGGFVEKYESKRVQNVGLQFLECVFPANEKRGPEEMMKSQKFKVKDYRFADEMFNHLLILMDHAENCWVRNVRSVWFRNFVRVGTNALAITFQHCYHTFPMPPSPDPKKPLLAGQFAFEISGQMILIEHCHAEYSFHAYSYKGRVPGPNVVYSSSCVAKNGDVGPHMKWSTGQLYDNCNVDGQIIIQDRYDAGSGHGWSGANSVVWNSVAHSGMIVQKPPLSQNFLIGSSSKRAKPRVQGHEWAWEESPDRKVNPPSLYMAQLAERRQRLSSMQNIV